MKLESYKHPARVLLLGVFSIGLAACARCGQEWTAIDLLTVPATSAFEVERIDLGEESAAPYLGDGWDEPENWGGRLLRWSLGPSATLRFHVGTPRQLTLRALVAPHGPQPAVEIRLAGRRIANWSLSPEFSEQRVTLPAALLHAGENILEVVPSTWSAPAPDGQGDRRRLAILWDRLEIEGAEAASPPRLDPSRGAATLPRASELSWTLPPAREYRVHLGGVESVGGPGSGLEFELRWNGGTRVTHRIEAPREAIAWTALAPAGTSAARLSLRPTGQGGARVLAPRVELSAGGLDDSSGPLSEQGGRRWLDWGHPDRRAAAAGGSTPKRPDVIIYLVDTLRADRVGPQGGSRSLTPAIDRLAAESVVFERAIAQSSWTRPTVASIFTGLLPQEHTAFDRDHGLPTGVATLAEVFRDAGYATAAIVANGNVASEFGFAQGFDLFEEPYKQGVEPTAETIQRRATEWLDKRDRRRPLLLFLHVVEPHAPYDPPAQLLRRLGRDVVHPFAGSPGRFDALALLPDGPDEQTLADLRTLYDGDVALLDDRIAPFLDHLRITGDLDRSVFVFLSDHGEEFWEHASLAHGTNLNAEQLNIPFFIRLPGRSQTERRSRELVQQIDLMPTLLELVGAEPPYPLSGRSLAPHLLRGEGVEQASIFSHLDVDHSRASAVIRDREKLIRTAAGLWGSRTELYDMDLDPGERSNLAPARLVDVDWMLGISERLRSRRFATVTRAIPEEETLRHLRALGYAH